MPITKTHPTITIHKAAIKCSDYDDECVEVKDPISCWYGGDIKTKNGIKFNMPIADGYCPLMFNK